MSGAGIHQRLHKDYQPLLETTIVTEGRLFPTIYRYYEEYCALAEAGETALRDLRERRLAEQLRHAATAVPAYRGMDPAARLDEWPFTTKADLRDRLVDHCDDAIDLGTSRLGYTSGTTGIPIKVIHDLDHVAHKYALALRRNTATGLPLRRRILIPMRDGAMPWLEYASPAHGNSIIAQFGSAGADRGVIARAGVFEPDIVYGHPSNCLMFAEALGSARVNVQPRFVLTYGETLSRSLRDQLESGYGAPVRDGYGMREFGSIAVQCEKGAYHVESERLVLELVDEHDRPVPPGQPGELIVTDLTNRAMPLIRYRTSDTARLSPDPCDCGYPGDVLTVIEGRDLGLIPFDNGVTLPVNALTRVVRRYPLRRFQIVRRTATHLDVLIMFRRRTWPAEVLAQLTADVESYVEKAATVTVRLATDDEFLRNDSGKDTDYVSLV